MNIIKKQGIWNLFDRTTGLLLMSEETLDTILENPELPLLKEEEKGFSAEKTRLYDTKTSLMDICKKGKEEGATRLELSYDFFFGGSKRENYPDSPKTIESYKVIHDVAEQFNMGFSASIVSPLDIGGGYAKTHSDTGYTCQFKEGSIDENGAYALGMIFQKQWTNNKGPIQLKLEKIVVYGFDEERIENTSLYFVDVDQIEDISGSVQYEIDEASIQTTFNGYGFGKMKIWGNVGNTKKSRCLVVAVYRTPELDYFADDAIDYMKGVIQQHNDHGIKYSGFYSDEMHIQFDWDLFNHFGHDSEINTRYYTENLAATYAQKYGSPYKDFLKYFVFFSYHQHDFLAGDESKLPSQHVFGKDEKSIYETWLFRKRYFEMLQRRVVDLCLDTKKYAEDLYERPIMAKGHSTWQEAPTCDRFYEEAQFSEFQNHHFSRYDYTPDYIWSSSIRENIAACYDYFKWNEYLTGGGTDHPEGGCLDRNYYGCAFASSLAVLNKYPISYYGFWGGPKPIMQALANIGIAYGNHSLGYDLRHNIVQNLTPRTSDVLTLYPLDLNYVEERFGSWMVQYGYTNYITEDELLKNYRGCRNKKLVVKEEAYRTLVVFYSPFISKDTLALIGDFLRSGGKVIWSSAYPLTGQNDEDIFENWKAIFGIEGCSPAFEGKTAKGSQVIFNNQFSGIHEMTILTDLLPDFVYSVTPSEHTEAIASIGNEIVGTYKAYPEGGAAVYLGFRPRDDQSGSTGEDVDTLFSILKTVNAYDEDSFEVFSREKSSQYLVNNFKNGSVSLTNHIRTFYEDWEGKFFRDEAEDAKALEGRVLPETRIELKKFVIKGNEINYLGQGILTIHVDENGLLKGFAGENTKEIAINGQVYKFCDVPATIAWAEISKEHLDEGIDQAYAIFTNQEGCLTLPIQLAEASQFKAVVCERDLFGIQEQVFFKYTPSQVSFDVNNNEQGKWILLYKENLK
ncbi:MAG: hypothetical protein H7X94_00190 [Vallitaleaceae bacterium]|nr:hypothetical protein [Vallitaleaceae bacterium]